MTKKKLYALRLRQFASWGCNSCVPDEYIEKKKRSVLIDMLHFINTIFHDNRYLAISCDFLFTRDKKVFYVLKPFPIRIKTFTVYLNIYIYIYIYICIYIYIYISWLTCIPLYFGNSCHSMERSNGTPTGTSRLLLI